MGQCLPPDNASNAMAQMLAPGGVITCLPGPSAQKLCSAGAKGLRYGGVQVHGDVFRAPTNSALLAVYVGTGSQLLGMALVTMVFAVLGFLSPANRGGLMTAMLLLFAFMGLVGGYFSARLYKRFKVGPRCSTRLPPPLSRPSLSTIENPVEAMPKSLDVHFVSARCVSCREELQLGWAFSSLAIWRHL